MCFIVSLGVCKGVLAESAAATASCGFPTVCVVRLGDPQSRVWRRCVILYVCLFVCACFCLFAACIEKACWQRAMASCVWHSNRVRGALAIRSARLCVLKRFVTLPSMCFCLMCVFSGACVLTNSAAATASYGFPTACVMCPVFLWWRFYLCFKQNHHSKGGSSG